MKFLILSTNSLVVKMIRTPILSDLNDTICTKQYLRKCQITNSLSNQTSWDTNRTTTCQFQNNLLESTNVNTCNITTKHSDYFLWKNTSERVARRCDDNVDRKRVNSGVLKHLFLEGVEKTKQWPEKPGNALSDALLMTRCQKFAAGAEKTRVFWNRALHGFN